MKKKLVSFVFVVGMIVSAIGFAACSKDVAQNQASETKWVKSVDIVVPAKAGGGTDLMARAQFVQIGKDAGISAGIINNETGNSVVAMEDVRTAKADGSKLLFFNGGFLARIASGIYKHTLDDFTVIGVAHGPDPAYALLVSPDSDIKNIQDLIARAKEKPGKLLFGCNIGATTHIMGAEFAAKTGTQFKYVASGADTATLTELVGHNIDVCYANVNQAKQYVESGKAVALGVLTQDNKERSPLLPQIPTMIEQGYDLNFLVLTIVLGPKGMNNELVKKIHSYLVSSSENPEVEKLLKPAGFDVVYYDYNEGVEILKMEQKKYSDFFEIYGLKK